MNREITTEDELRWENEELKAEIDRLRNAIKTHQVARYAVHAEAEIVGGHPESDEALWDTIVPTSP